MRKMVLCDVMESGARNTSSSRHIGQWQSRFPYAEPLLQRDDEVLTVEVLLAGVGGGVELDFHAPRGIRLVRDDLRLHDIRNR